MSQRRSGRGEQRQSMRTIRRSIDKTAEQRSALDTFKAPKRGVTGRANADPKTA